MLPCPIGLPFSSTFATANTILLVGEMLSGRWQTMVPFSVIPEPVLDITPLRAILPSGYDVTDALVAKFTDQLFFPYDSGI